jgi:hypothetical protein
MKRVRTHNVNTRYHTMKWKTDMQFVARINSDLLCCMLMCIIYVETFYETELYH